MSKTCHCNLNNMKTILWLLFWLNVCNALEIYDDSVLWSYSGSFGRVLLTHTKKNDTDKVTFGFFKSNLRNWFSLQIYKKYSKKLFCEIEMEGFKDVGPKLCPPISPKDIEKVNLRETVIFGIHSSIDEFPKSFVYMPGYYEFTWQPLKKDVLTKREYDFNTLHTFRRSVLYSPPKDKDIIIFMHYGKTNIAEKDIIVSLTKKSDIKKGKALEIILQDGSSFCMRELSKDSKVPVSCPAIDRQRIAEIRLHYDLSKFGFRSEVPIIVPTMNYIVENPSLHLTFEWHSD